MRGRRHANNNRTTSKLRRKVAAASGMPSGTRSSGQMVHNMDKCHNLSVPCSSAVRDVLCDIFPELSEKLPYKQSLLGQIIRNYLMQEKDQRLRTTNECQSKKKRKKKKKKSIEPVINQSFMKSMQSSSILDNNKKQQIKRKLDIFLEKLPTLNEKNSNEKYQHSSQNKVPPESRELSALLKFIQCQYQEFKKPSNQICKGCPILGLSEIPTIPLQKLQLLCERIQCQSCRDGTLCSLKNIEDKKSLNTFVLDASGVAIPDLVTNNWLAVPVSNFNHDGDGDAHDIDRAFDYVGMEEGYEPCLTAKKNIKINASTDLNDGGPQLNFVIARDEGSGDRFVQLQPLEGSDQAHSFPFSTLDVDGIIRHIIIPCGLNEMEQQKDKIPPEEISKMRKEASRMVENFVDKLKCLTRQIGVIQNLLHEARGNIGVFAPSESKKLRECDSKCEMYMESFVEFLISLHSSTSAARCAIHLEQKWLNGINNKLWEGYDRAIQSLIKPSLNHRWKVIHFQEKSAKSPPMYNCTIQRTYMQDMIDEKLKILSQLNDMLDQVLVSPSSEEGCTRDLTNLKRVVAHAVYFSNKYIKIRCYDTLDDVLEYKSLLNSRSASVCKTIHETKVFDVLEIQSKRIESMRNQAKLLIQKMEVNREAIIVQLPQKYESLWKANNILIEDRTIIGDDNFRKCGKSQAESEENELRDSCILIEDVGRQCRLLEDLKTLDSNWGDNNVAEKLISPGFSENLDSAQIVLTVFGNEGIHHQMPEKCDGGGGKRRVMSIISACIYGWLQDRCMEWHADLTQKELLSAVEDESLGMNGLRGSIPRTKKTTKKKKEKQKSDTKKSACLLVETEPSEKENTDAKECTLAAIGGDKIGLMDEYLLTAQGISELPDDNKGKNHKISKFVEDGELVSGNMNMIDSKKTIITQTEISHYYESIVNQDMACTLQAPDLKLEDEIRTSVGVVFGTDFTSAKDYLINRYLKLQLTDGASCVQL